MNETIEWLHSVHRPPKINNPSSQDDVLIDTGDSSREGLSPSQFLRRVLTGDAKTVLATLPSSSFQCCVTSPAYYQLRDYQHPDQLGLEATPQEYVVNLVSVLREVKRVLRDDGTLWLNLGDTYLNSGRGGQGGKQTNNRGSKLPPLRTTVPAKNLLGIPWRVAFALQDDGWYLRSAIVWSKGNPFPESVKDRPTSSYEHVFLLAKSECYYYDADAIKEPATGVPSGKASQAMMDAKSSVVSGGRGGLRDGYPAVDYRNSRNVWKINVKPSRNIHYATMPLELAERCIQAGSSEHGCCTHCGSPYQRVIHRPVSPPETRTASDHPATSDTGSFGAKLQNWKADNPSQMLGWEATCNCNGEITQCRILDPFGGAGTTGLAARNLGRDYTLIELNPDYTKLAEDRLGLSEVTLP